MLSIALSVFALVPVRAGAAAHPSACAAAPVLSPAYDAAPDAQDIAPPVRTRVDYRVRPIIDLHFWVRDLASRSDKVPDVAGLESAVLAARALEAELASPLAWGPIEGLLGDCETGHDVREAFARLPETMDLRGGKKVELRAGALKLADALLAAEPAFVERVWPEHERAIDAARSKLAELFTPKESIVLGFHVQSLGFTDDGKALPVCLVFRAPAPGAVTQRDDAGRGVSFMAVDGVAGTMLVEVMVHELTHQFDVVDKGESVLAKMRKALEAKGVTARDREYRDIPHTLMFVQSAETVQRTIDPAHVHYGVASGYYARTKYAADVELPIWKAHLDGKKTREEAIEEMVRGALAARTGK